MAAASNWAAACCTDAAMLLNRADKRADWRVASPSAKQLHSTNSEFWMRYISQSRCPSAALTKSQPPAHGQTLRGGSSQRGPPSAEHETCSYTSPSLCALRLQQHVLPHVSGNMRIDHTEYAKSALRQMSHEQHRQLCCTTWRHVGPLSPKRAAFDWTLGNCLWSCANSWSTWGTLWQRSRTASDQQLFEQTGAALSMVLHTPDQQVLCGVGRVERHSWRANQRPVHTAGPGPTSRTAQTAMQHKYVLPRRRPAYGANWRGAVPWTTLCRQSQLPPTQVVCVWTSLGVPHSENRPPRDYQRAMEGRSTSGTSP